MRQETQQPWLDLGISRATYYRLGKPRTKPKPRKTQAQLAAESDFSVRTYERAARIFREAPDLAADLSAGRLRVGTAERLLIARQEPGRFDGLLGGIGPRRVVASAGLGDSGTKRAAAPAQRTRRAKPIDIAALIG
ncbi:hypothetical protein SAMN05519103_01949 [Rhizobiales bacterium GAS113]|nr:hypothetical protein SAMN05519103_01949 [Rhizobiales bacterium GAS113]